MKPEDLTCIIDSREQLPLDVTPLKSIKGTLSTGDYSIAGLEHVVCVERKSLADIVACCGHGRERFEREMQRILAYPARMMIIEGSMSQIALKQYRSSIHPNSVIGSILGWQAHGIPIMFVPDHAEAGRMVARFLFIVSRRRYEESRIFCETLKSS